MWFISYWFWPVFSSLVWLAMLITMITVWSTEGYPHYSSMDSNQSIAYISDVGAQGLKPLFIAMSAVTVVSFDVAFILERWLRHTGRLTPNTSIWQKLYSLVSVIAAIAGAAGLILLSIFDALRHPRLHNTFLVVFLGGYIISAIFICWEYQRLGIHYRETSVLRYSFWVKLFFIITEVALAIAFGVTQNQEKYNAAAVLEWIIAFIFFFYVLSFFIDFMPAVRTKDHQSRETEMDMRNMEHGDGAANGERYFRGAPATNGHTNGYTNGYTNGETNGYTNGYTHGNTNGYANGHTDTNGYIVNSSGIHPGYPNGSKPTAPIPASQNF